MRALETVMKETCFISCLVFVLFLFYFVHMDSLRCGFCLVRIRATQLVGKTF